MDPVGVQLWYSRAAILHFLAFLANQDPVGILSGSTQKRAKTLQKSANMLFFLKWIWVPPDIGAQLDPDWIPIGSRFVLLKKHFPRLFPKFEHPFLKFQHLAVHHPAQNLPRPPH